MPERQSRFRRLAHGALAASFLSFLVVLFQPTVAYALGDNKLPNSAIVTPCPPLAECRTYEEIDKAEQTIGDTILLAVVLAALNAFTYMTQQLAQYTANFIISGGKGGGAAYEGKSFFGFLQDAAGDAANNFIVEMNNYSKVATRFDLCSPFGLQAFDLQLTMGFGRIWQVQKKQGCGFKEIAANFDASVQSLSNADILSTVKANFQPDRSDLGIAVRFNQQLLTQLDQKLKAAEANRNEFGGFKPLVDLISGNIRTPAETLKQTLAQTNAIEMQKESNRQTFSALTVNAFKIGVYQLPIVFGATLLNTLANSGLAALKNALSPKPNSDDLKFAQLDNPFAQQSAEKTSARAAAFTDIVVPNLFTTENQDFVHELSSCPTPRGLWGCSMDETFALGLRAADDNGAFTVARAMGIGTDGKGLVFLHPDWQLIPESDTKENQDPGCYQRAYCAANLAKLRFARILPIGWEIAANSPYNKKLNGRYVTLGEAAQNFSNCNDKGQIDETHPWCHLIDPSWVVTAPPFQCRVRGYGDTVIGGSVPVRFQECSDVVSCVERNDKGECTGGYGYCLSEKTAWRFAADTCQEKFVSCRTYQKRNTEQAQGNAIPADTSGGQPVSYLRNTIDYGSCSDGNVGCMYYATTHDVTGTSTDKWVGALALSPSPKLDGSRIYFDATAESCPANADGCTKVLKVSDGEPSLNLVKNGSFENADPKGGKKFDAWDLSASGSTYPVAGGVSLFGSKSAEFPVAGDMAQVVPVAPLRNYVLSYYARKSGTAFAAGQILLFFQKSSGASVAGGKFYRSSNCNSASGATLVGADTTALTDQWQRFTCEFVSNDDAARGVVIMKGVGNGLQVDGIQLEEGNAATDFVDGANPALAADHLKLAPEELACSGNVKTDRKECANYARVCKQTDTGCQGYTDADSGDATEIPATVSRNDICPLECVGYAEYRKLPSAFDLTRNPDVPLLDDKDDETSASFVPSSGQSCTAAGVGCEEFTNIEAATAGGEQKSDWSYVRACSKPNADSTTYFTWEGSETTGYQLRTWSFIKDKSVTPSPPLILVKAGPDGAVKDPAGCTAAAWKSGADPDCRQMYDEKGNAFYRYFSQTIVSSPDCRNYRLNGSDVSDCSKTGGTFNPTTSECVYSVLASQSVTCPASEISCRAYMGSTGRNSATVATEKFSKAGFVSTFMGGSGTDIATSPEALTVGDNSLKVSSKSGGALSLTYGYASAKGGLYTLVFWAKTTDAKRPTATVSVDGKTAGTFAPQVDWSRFEIGPFAAGTAPTSTITWSGLPNATFIDELSIRRLQDIVYVKKNSWVTPASCDQTIEGIPTPQAMLGCRRYNDRNGVVATVRQFSHLCRYESIGCTAYVDTRNSTDAYAQSYVLKGLDKTTKSWDSLYADTITVTRPADRYVYVIDEPGAHCDAANESCRAFGKPKFKADRSLAGFETVYLKDDIAKYVDDGGEPNMLCRPSELFCEKYTSGPITSYFRDPGDHACEWRDKVEVPKGLTTPPGQYSGWFVKGTDATPCYPEKLSSGNTFLSEFTAAPGYRGWTDTCPEEQSECTEFRDPNDHTDLAHPLGRPYFFINNDKLDKTTCNGRADLLSGCVLFRDMNDSRLLYSTVATYAKSQSENNVAESPINCDTDAGNPFCRRAGRCTNLTGTAISAVDEKAAMASLANAGCATDDDCTIAGLYCPAAPTVVKTCTGSDTACVDPLKSSCTTALKVRWAVTGKCSARNDSNLVVKVKLDRDCQTWLGCSSGETVYDSAQGKYVDLCTNVAVCDKALGTQGKDFCAHYVDRKLEPTPVPLPRDTFYENVLRQGMFVNADAYTSRQIGLGKPDYSGYTIPNHFQASDLQTRRVAYELLANRPGSVRNRYVNDYRLVAAVRLSYNEVTNPIPTFPPAGGQENFTGPEKAFLRLFPANHAYRYFDPKFPYLNLCQDVQTGQVGYYLADKDRKPLEKPPVYCYLAIDTPYTQNPADLIPGGGGVNPRNAQDLAVLFEQLEDPTSRQPLTQAFPPAECKAYPDGSSPFPNSYVKEWDFTSDPPKPKSFVPGYDNAPVCEFGENCACSYRKVVYGRTTKYFSPFGSPAPIGICVGGDRDGQTCVPNAVIESTGATSTQGVGVGADSVCGTTGVCESIQSVSYIRGQFGQCLERDMSRTVAGSQENNPCLVWNPTPLLFGQNDTYHYQPTAGYLPPQNSGEYYCVSSAVPPSTVSRVPLNPDWIQAPGSMDSNQFHYDDAFVSDGSCVSAFNFLLPDSAKCTGNDAMFIDGAKADGGWMGSTCESADDDQDKGGNGVDFSAGRWVMTGRGKGRNYAEYFIGLNSGPESGWAKWLTKNDAPTTDQVQDAFLERNFSYFGFSAIHNPNGRGRIGCGYTQDWVDGVSVDNYDKLDQTQEASKQWEQSFNRDFKSYLTPSSQDFLRTEDGTQLLKLPCYWSDASKSGGGKCYYKYWELGYHDDGQDKFQMMYKAGGGPARFDPQSSLLFFESKASRPFFSIRAMFEDANGAENKKSADDLGPTGNRLGGPFRFVGFWITSSVPGADSERALYMYLTISHADICREVAQVVAPDTRETAAFTDRAWEQGGFSIPKLGVTWNSTNPPFGAALATRPIGRSPLFQVRGRLPGIQSKLNPPDFIASGIEYFRGDTPPNGPNGNWGWLTNVFARVYRIYHYYDRPVVKGSWACIAGPNFGTWCPEGATGDDARKYCGYSGTCVPALLSSSEGSGFCNALSGVNAGTSCSGANTDALGGYHVCHAAPLKNKNGILTPIYNSCEIQTTGTGSWKAVSGGYTCINCGWWSKNIPPGNTAIDNKTYTDGGDTYALITGGPDAGKKIFAERTFTEDEILAGKWMYRLGGDLVPIYITEPPFRCAKGSVTMPDTSTGLPSATTITCLHETDGPSKECPAQVLPGKDMGDGNIYSKCIAKVTDKSSSLYGYGHCDNGFEQTQCNDDSQCRFTWFEWWGIEADGTFPTKPKVWSGLSGSTPPAITDAHAPYLGGECRGGVLGCVGVDPKGSTGWWTSTHAFGTDSNLGEGDQKSKTGNGDIAGFDLYGGRGYLPSDLAYLNRYPGAYGAAFVYSGAAGSPQFIPGHCERPPRKNPLDPTEDFVAGVSPYSRKRLFGGGPTPPMTSGVCDRGINAGRSCTSNTQCLAPSELAAKDADSANWCKPVSDTSGAPTSGKAGAESYDCRGKGDPLSDDPALDDNNCTNAAGYQPRLDLCGNDPTRQQCLTAVTQSDKNSFDTKKSQQPTDVTNGLYTPAYLGGAIGDSSSFGGSYDYVAYYTPRPPIIAAPDTSRQCPSGGSCPIARVNAFTFENQTEGNVGYVGGQSIATMRFYGWAADNQAPLKDMWVDWGDGTVQEFHDARMKNKKPYCGGSKECQNVPGLTCNTDGDCPAGGGKCASVGTCRARPYISCGSDADCSTGGGKDRCVFRTAFGNSDDACEKNYFEFTHAYACGSDARTALPACGTSGRCARNNAVACTSGGDCGPLDKCLTTLAAPGGCFDATKASCRYTPRVLLKDNWGWCTGECRVQNVDGKLKGGFGGKNAVLFNNGGCYDGSKDYQNANPAKSFISAAPSFTNLCDPASASGSYSPWVVYGGAMNLGIAP